MGNNSKFLAGIIVGAAAGAAITLLLNTESGKKVLAEQRNSWVEFVQAINRITGIEHA